LADKLQNDYSIQDTSESARKKRETYKSRPKPPPMDSGSPGSNQMPNHPSNSKRNTECPTIPPEYNTELQRMLPPDYLNPQNGHSFNISEVINFVDLYTICT